MLLIAGDFIAADFRTTNWKPSLETRTTDVLSFSGIEVWFLVLVDERSVESSEWWGGGAGGEF
jgi:hypothetical protein